jgi:beta-glucosidase
MTRRDAVRTVVIAAALIAQASAASQPEQRWMDPSLDPDARAALVLAQMTRDEKLTLLSGYYASVSSQMKYTPPEEVRPGSAGYVPGIARLEIPPQWLTDAGIGVATQWTWPEKRERTALPSGLATAASWNPKLAYEGGVMIGAEARASGFNVMLAGGADLIREPRNGRNFEYAAEDPLLAGKMVGAQIAGIQSNHIISTLKHFALNDQETDRAFYNVHINPDQARMSDLLAFQIAIEQSDPGSVMCAYNELSDEYACENTFLLTDVLRRDWAWKGYVMSDWGAAHSTIKAANAGLEQESGFQFDSKRYFGDALRGALQTGEISEARFTQMASRILRTMFAKGVIDHPVEIGTIDFKAHADVTRRDAEQGAVLLKNDGALLPIDQRVRRIAVIGAHADKGVLSGGGSSQVYPVGGTALPGLKPIDWPGPVIYYPSSPLSCIRNLARGATVSFADGTDLAAAQQLAKHSDIALVFVTQWTTESVDTSLTLPDGQDALVEAVAGANSHTVVVLETGGPVFMPWIEKVAAILEAWYPGTSGGEAIGNLLFGRSNPSGHLPVTFPRDESQLIRPNIVERNEEGKKTFQLTYSEGATVGYKWFDARARQPLFPFGYGLSYTRFSYRDLKTSLDGPDLLVSFRVRNDGKRAGMDVPQIYVSPAAGGWEAPKRLAGWAKIDLKPRAETTVTLRVDPRLLGLYSSEVGGWTIAPGTYDVMLGRSSRDLPLSTSTQLPERRLPSTFRP